LGQWPVTPISFKRAVCPIDPRFGEDVLHRNLPRTDMEGREIKEPEEAIVLGHVPAKVGITSEPSKNLVG